MSVQHLRVTVLLLADVLLLLVCIFHIPSVLDRPRAPFDAVWGEDGVAAGRVLPQAEAEGLRPGDLLIGWNGRPVIIPEVVEFYADLGTVGEEVSLIVVRDGRPREVLVPLVPFYDTPRYLIVVSFVGILIWVIGVVILWKSTPSPAAATLHWTMMAFAVTILITWGKIDSESTFTYVTRALWIVAYMSVVALLFFFSTQYPVRRRGRTLWWALAAFVPAVALIAVLLDSHLRAIATSSGETYALFHRAFTVFQASLLIYTAGAVANFLLSYRAARSSEERKRLQWIIWGLTIGAAPFLLFYILPQILFSRYLIPEEYTTICFVVIAGAFTISFLRYRMFDIDLLINRSIVYSAISLFLLVAYGLVVLLVASIVGGERVFEESILIAVGTLIIALLLNPLRSRIQGVVDQTFYATRVHYHRTIRSLSELLHGALTSTALFEQLGASLVSSLPLNTFAAYRVTDGALRLRYHRGGTPPLTIRLSTPTRAVLSSTSILALPSIIDRPGEQIDIAHAEILATLRVPLCLSLLSERHMLLGVLLLTPYSEKVRFREEEVDFLLTAGRQAGAALERLLLQEQLFRQQEESQRSQELSRLKSYFVSSVSHELRMPLTSIRMFAETLRTHRVTAKDRQEYLSIIEGESERLTRLIENILDFASIERGGKEYRARRVSFAPIVQRAVQSMQYPMRKHDARLRTHLPKRLPPIEADPDALEQVIINLLSNALKYSLRPKRIWLTARPRGPFLEIEVRDRGIGIPAEEIPRLFEPFHRVRDPAVAQVGGAGLGLALVKHIVDAHHGQISIRSAVSRGTAVLVTLPLHQPTEGTTP